MHHRLKLKSLLKVSFVLILAAGLSACNLGREDQEPIDNTPPSNVPTGKPVATIVSPTSGDEFVVNEEILVSANATDSVGVTRVQLFANGQIVKTVSSDSVSGDSNMNVLLDYKPRATGTVTLRVVAFRGATASDPAEIEINVRSSQAQVTATSQPASNVPVIDPNDPTCRALTNTGLNFRTGPGTNYDRIKTFAAGVVVPIMGRLGDNSWWQVRDGTQIGWISAQFTTTYGNCGGIPVAAPPPSPTPLGGVPTATPTATPTSTNTPQAPTATSTPGTPDLVVVNVSGPDTVTIPAGETSVAKMYTVTISNTGSGRTGQFSNTITILPGGSPLDLGVVGNLNAGENIILTINLTFTTPGTYTVQASADSDGDVSEISEVNNTGGVAVTVTSG